MNAAALYREIASGKPNGYLLLLATTAFLAGIFFRFWDLGGAPLAVDEYFFGTSILNTAKHGLPEFDCGGYYIRGVFIQYLTVPLLALGANLEFAVRFWPAVASILSIVAVWRLGLLIGGVRTASIAVVLISLSVWEVEFARFGRMYAPFQAAFLWYLYFQARHLIKGSEQARWWYLCISGLAIFIYEGAALLLVANFLALIWPGKRWNFAHLCVASGLLVAAVGIRLTDFRHMGATADVAAPSMAENGGHSLTDILSLVPVDLATLTAVILPIAAFAALLLGAVLWRYRAALRVAHAATMYWFFVVLCFGCGFIMFGVALVLAGLLMNLELPVRNLNVKPGLLIVGLVALTMLWFGVLIASSQLGGDDIVSSVKNALRHIFDYPDVYFKIVDAWMQAIPVTTLSLAILAAIALTVTLRSKQRALAGGSYAGYLFGVTILLVLLVAILPLPYATTRYTYFLYPLLIILASLGINYIVEMRDKKGSYGSLAVVILLAPIFVFAEDFRLAHLARINEPGIRFRTEYSTDLAEHYYLRWDFRSVASYVNENVSPADKVIIFEQPLPHYLTRTSGIFIRAGSENHGLVQGCGSERDLWSNAKLLDEESEVLRMINEAGGRVWLIVRTANYAFRDPMEWSLIERYALSPRFLSQDGYLAVYLIESPADSTSGSGHETEPEIIGET